MVEHPILDQQRIHCFSQQILFSASGLLGEFVEQLNVDIVEIQRDLRS
jgi:hypothetical protein